MSAIDHICSWLHELLQLISSTGDDNHILKSQQKTSKPTDSMKNKDVKQSYFSEK